MRTVSIGAQLEQLDGLRGTKDLSEWEANFVANMVVRYVAAGKSTTALTDRMVEKIEQIWTKHFA